MFELQGSNLLLKIDDIYSYKDDVKLGVPNNGFFTLTVETKLYKGISKLEIDIKDLQLFFSDVIHLWTTLNKGEAIIKEPFGYNQYLQFKSNGGFFDITGEICDVDGCSYKMTFFERLDQSYLNSFINQIKKFNYNDHLR